VGGFTQLGLVEMTRKRTRESLAHMLCEPCPTCQGRGQVKTARSVCYDILREILREARQFNPKEFRVVASAPAVVEMLLDEESQHLAAVGLHRQADLAKLQGLKYEYRPDIRDRAALERNFREKFEALNRVT
jgi:Ribonuclease G/E